MGTWSRMTQTEFQKIWQAVDRARKKYEDHDPYTAQHSIRVAHWAVLLASRVPGFAPPRLRRLEITALLHDFGKTFVNPAVLRKTGPLTDDEWTEMKRHPELGIEHLPVPGEVVFPQGILWHHKRFDGGGYPDGKVAGVALPLEARIISVADVFDALTSARTYRVEKPSYTPDEALGIMHESAGRQLDPTLVALFGQAHQAECDRVGGRAGARTMQVRSVIGEEIDRAQSLLGTIIGPFDPNAPLRRHQQSKELVLGRLVTGLLRANLDLRSAENVARHVLRLPLAETFNAEDIVPRPQPEPGSGIPRHHLEVSLLLRKMPAKLAYMHVVVYKDNLWMCVGEQRGELVEVTLAR